jgi:competence protein ComEA
MPSTPAERRALAIVASIAALGVVARVIKSRHARPAPTAAEALALDAQIARVQAARAAAKDGKSAPRSRKGTTAVSESRTSRSSSQNASDPRAREPLDLDTAGATAIEALPFIGPSLAARIVESRDKCGPFGSLEALTRVYGIGEGMTKRLAPHVTFSTPSRPKGADLATCSSSAKNAAPRGRGRS